MKKILVILVAILLCALFVACSDLGDSTDFQKITMPQGSEDYVGNNWKIDDLVEHFKELGFKKITKEEVEPDDDDYRDTIYTVVIASGWIGTDPWIKGEEFDPDDEITIYYNKYPMLTVDNCEDVQTILNSSDVDFQMIANKYDGRYIEFEACVVEHLTYWGNSGHVISVVGGDSVEGAGLNIRIGDNSFGCEIDESVEVGDLVIVSGRIDEEQSEYYKVLYVETMYMRKR